MDESVASLTSSMATSGNLRAVRKGGGRFLAAFVLVLTWSQSLRASELPALRVVRSADAADCPDAQGLAGSVALLEGRLSLLVSAAPEARPIEVVIDHDAREGYRASIRVPITGAAPREIRDRSPTCGPLWDALTVALALIVDGELVAPSAPPVEQPALPALPRVVEAERLKVGLGGLVSTGVVRSFAAGIAADAVYAVNRHLTVDAEGRFLTSAASVFAPGTVQVELFAGLVGGCYAFNPEPQRWRVSGCLEVGAGVIRGQANGYVDARAANRPWLTTGAGLSADVALAGPLSAWFRGEGLALLQREQFAITGIRDSVYEPSALGWSGGAGLGMTIW